MVFLVGMLLLSVLGAAAGLGFGWLPAGVGGVVCAVLLAVGIFLALVVLFALVLWIFSLFVDLDKEQTCYSRTYAFLVDQLLHVSFFLARVRVHAQGLELVPRDRRFLLVSNHLQALDPIYYLYLMPWARLGFISKKENYKIYLVNKYMHKIRCLPIDRENDRAALRTILATVRILQEGTQSMAVFPEGYTSRDGKLHEFRNGVFKIAQKAKVPIVVCVLENTPALTHNMFRRRTDVSVRVLGVVEPEEIVHETTHDVGQRIHTMMEQALGAQGGNT